MAERLLHTGSRRSTAMFQARKRNRLARELSYFAALIASPFDLGEEAAGDPLSDPLVMPASGRLAVSHSEDVAAGDITLEANGSGVLQQTPAIAADIIHNLPTHYKKGDSIEVASLVSLPAGDLTLYILDEWNRPFAIATGVVT